MIESAVQLLHLVQSMKVTVTVTLNAEEDLPVGEKIVLQIFHLVQIAVGGLGLGGPLHVCLVGALLVRKYYGFNMTYRGATGAAAGAFYFPKSR
jgi:hypothetical protein